MALRSSARSSVYGISAMVVQSCNRLAEVKNLPSSSMFHSMSLDWHHAGLCVSALDQQFVPGRGLCAGSVWRFPSKQKPWRAFEWLRTQAWIASPLAASEQETDEGRIVETFPF